jgi:hypothetical protein
MSEHEANLILAETPQPATWVRPSICRRPQRLSVLARLLLWLTR